MKQIAYLISIILFFLLGIAHGALSTDPKIISEKLHSCEAKGGKYSIFWNDYADEYREYCEIKAQKITDY